MYRQILILGVILPVLAQYANAGVPPKTYQYATAERWQLAQLVTPDLASDSPFENIQCPQRAYEAENVVGIEDCLYLHVLAPERTEQSPVLVHFHGGGFVGGAAGNGLETFDAIVDEGVIVVSVNYRLGLLGNITTDEISGNFALSDMQQALMWVKTYISEFGGDPNNVTILGHSAGGMAVQMLVASPKSEGLFNRAVSMSGYGAWPQPRDGAHTAQYALDANPMRMSADALVNAVDGFLIPVLDANVLPQQTISVYRAGSAQSVPLWIGAASFDGSVMPGSGVTPEMLVEMIAPRHEDILSTYDAMPLAYKIATMFGDVRYGYSSFEVAKAHGAQGNSVYAYYFDYVPSELAARLPGTPHGLDKAYFLDAKPNWVSDEDWQQSNPSVERARNSLFAFIRGDLEQVELTKMTPNNHVVNAIGRQDRLASYLERLYFMRR